MMLNLDKPFFQLPRIMKMAGRFVRTHPEMFKAAEE
jgi:hypothetical protein